MFTPRRLGDRSCPDSPLCPNWPSCSNCFVDNNDRHGLGSRMTPDTRTQLGDDGGNTRALHELSLHGLDLGSVARIVEPDTLDTPYDCLVNESPHAVSGCPHGSRPFEHIDDTVLDREDGFDLQDAGCNSRGLPDTSAFDEILHGTNEKVEMRTRSHPVQHRDDFVDPGSALSKFNSLHNHEAESETRRSYVIEMDAPGIGLLSCNVRAVECSTHAGRQMNAQHLVIRVCEQPRVDRDKILRAGLRRPRLGSSSLLRAEDVRRYLHKFAEEHSINRDLERHDRKAVLFSKTSRKVARRVRYDVNSHMRVATSPGRESQLP